jgi:D-glycero-D-manno-heptose 1,7-bisphosphate phosphatase
MIGDRDSDIECGKAAGTPTIIIEEPHSSGSRGSGNPDSASANLKDAVKIILNN